ncbi:MAG: flagellar biosynthesis anti-sigma factor FlgM [Thermoguttaceae bacterium]|nr:flagellar biosynthesis anti-sigma factor FlgM [Thermoguttaceae bacterium]MDW8037307.1 flagellar biosynthesis anti-sigma factor FlgM [Thermoguttaceae bacterium]
MEIYGPQRVHGAQPIGPPHGIRLEQAAHSTPAGPIQDELTISEAAQALERARQVPGIRADLVARVRAEIAAGTYETPEKLQIALDRLLDEIS